MLQSPSTNRNVTHLHFETGSRIKELHTRLRTMRRGGGGRPGLSMKNWMVLTVAAVFAAFLLTNVARVRAAGGDIDPSFNYGGIAGGSGGVVALALQPDGKIIIGGTFTRYNGDANASDGIARLNTDGTLDTTFNYGGVGADNIVRAVAVQPNGKIIIGGDFTSYNGDASASNGIARLNADGTLDTTFNYGNAGANFAVRAVALQPDSKIIVGGDFTGYNGDTIVADNILRLNFDGTLDTSFNSGGAGANGVVQAVTLQADGKILIGGSFSGYNGDASAGNGIARLNSDGTLDTSFNYGGAAGTDGTTFTLAVQPNGKVVLGGNFTSYNGDANASDKILRLNSDGTLDTTFNYGGAGANLSVLALSLQADGKVLIGGPFTSYNGDTGASDRIARLNSDGTLDTSFNYGAGVRGTDNSVLALRLQPDGKVIIAGDFTSYNGDANAGDNVARLLPAPGVLSFSAASYSVNEAGDTATITLKRTGGADGRAVARVTLADVTTSPADYSHRPDGVDTSFNYGGAIGFGGINSLALQPDGKVIVGGSFGSNNDIGRLNANGTPDPSFDGLAHGVFTVALLPDGKIMVGGSFTAYSSTGRFGEDASNGIVRANSDGTLDTTFNYGRAGANGTVKAIALQADGKIMIGGDFTSYNGDGNASDKILRLNPDGSLDTTFNYGPGKGAGGSFPGAVNAIIVQPDGKIIIGGDFTSYNGDMNASDGLARLNSDGTLDTAFNYGPGKGMNSSIASPSHMLFISAGVALTLALQPDGKIIVGGRFASYNGGSSRGIVRVNTDGSLDTSFNRVNNFSGSGIDDFSRKVGAVALQPDGKIMIGGDFISYNRDASASNCIARLNADGTLDPTFNPGGMGLIGNPNSPATVNAMALQPDRKILIGGTFTAYNGDEKLSDNVARIDAEFIATWEAGDASDKTFQLPITNDTLDEGEETLTLTLTVLSGDVPAGEPSTATLTIVDNDLTISQVSGSGIVGGTATLTAKLTSGSAPVGGKTVGFKLNGTSVGEAVTDASGVARLMNVSLVGLAVGTYPNAVGASFAGDATFSSKASTGPLNVTNPPVVRLSTSSYSFGEGAGRATITIARNDASDAASVQYATSDPSGLNNCNLNTGHASARCDYMAAGGTLSFAAGEFSKTFTIPLVDDVFVEGDETLTVTLSNATGATLSTPSSASVTITDNDTTQGAANPIDTRSFLVRQLYLDFLNREPDPPGLAAWLDRLNTCPRPGETLQNCDEIEVASAFFRSPEFFDRGYFLYQFYEGSLVRQPQYEEFQNDLRRVTGFLTPAELEQRKQQFVEEFVQRAEFHALYDSFADGQPFVDAVLARAGSARPGVGAATIVTANRVSVINRLAAGQITRGQALRELMESPEVSQRFFNKAFVVMGYFAFLKRNPDAAYLQWINVLNTTGDYREMLRGFLQSAEYRFRFGT